MKEYHVNSAKELFSNLEDLKNSKAWAFRGQRDSSWSLLPKSGRKEFASKYGKFDEKSVFEAWKRYAVHYINQRPSDEWDWLSLAQHHGLATRLLDWTKNPLNAAFFAIDSNLRQESAIFAFKIKKREIVKEESPFDISNVGVYYPRGITARIISQRGIFTVSGEPTIPIEEQLGDRIIKIIISESAISDIQETLEFFGVNALSIYQDLDSLSQYLNYIVVSDTTGSKLVFEKDLPEV